MPLAATHSTYTTRSGFFNRHVTLMFDFYEFDQSELHIWSIALTIDCAYHHFVRHDQDNGLYYTHTRTAYIYHPHPSYQIIKQLTLTYHKNVLANRYADSTAHSTSTYTRDLRKLIQTDHIEISIIIHKTALLYIYLSFS